MLIYSYFGGGFKFFCVDDVSDWVIMLGLFVVIEVDGFYYGFVIMMLDGVMKVCVYDEIGGY